MSNFMPLTRSCSDSEINALEKLFANKCGSARLVSAEGEVIDLPEPVFELLEEIVRVLSSGQGVSVVPQDRELTTQEAADCLNVSRPYLIKLLEKGEIPHVKVGKSRRIALRDLMEYKSRRERDRRQSLDEMSAFLQDNGFYDD